MACNRFAGIAVASAGRRAYAERQSSGRVVVAMAKAQYRDGGPTNGSEEAIEAEVARRTDELRGALARAETLLQELDHRAKNNLQALGSLAVLKARRVKEPAARQALATMAERIGALSTAHRLIRLDGDGTWFDLRELLDDVSQELIAANKPEGIDVALDLAPITLSGDRAAPLALLVSELVGNALRHAFPHGRGRLSLRAALDGEIKVVVEDDGVGPAAHRSSDEGFGKILIDMLARQLRGAVVWEDAAPGTRAILIVPLDETGLKPGVH